MIKWIVRAALLWVIQRLAREYMEPNRPAAPQRKRRPARR
jgi:hypothetical protein